MAVLGVWIAFFPDASEAPATRAGMPYVIFYVGNWIRAVGGDLGALGHTWSLAIEEQFYLVWPFIIAVLLHLRISRPRLALLILGAVVSAALWRVALWDSVAFTRIYNGTDTRADPLLAGAFVACLPIDAWRNRLATPWFQAVAWAALAGCGALVVFSGFRAPSTYVISLPLVSVFVGTVIAAVLAAPTAPLSRLLGLRWIAFTGRISYGLYLWNTPVVILFRTFNLPLWLAAPAIIAVTYAAATISWFALERHVIPKGKQFTRMRAARATAAREAVLGRVV
jgi:peptidoglycan/LPS O-acetylase OafA/YrhL